MEPIDFIRSLLTLIDNAQAQKGPDYEEENTSDCGCGPNCGCRDCQDNYSNSPDEHITPVDTILSMGNDLNYPKHPADIRVSTVALYPNTAYKG